MHFVSIDSRFVPANASDAVEPGEYIATDVNGAYLIMMTGGGTMRPVPADNGHQFDATRDWNGKRILIPRTGGFGDLTLMTPLMREIKRRWPGCTLGISTMRHYSAALQNLPFIDGILPYPLLVSEAEKFDAWIFFENSIEKNPRATKVHMTDLFADIAGIDAIQDKHPAYVVTRKEISWCMVQYPRVNGTRRLCIHCTTSVPTRTYPLRLFGDIAGKFLNKGWEVFLIGAPNEVPAENAKNFRNLMNDNLTFRKTAAVVNNCDCLLGGDSAFVHVAGALDVPAIALYGAFPWSLRTAYSPSVTAIQGVGECSPCFWHPNIARANDKDLAYFPPNGPCRKAGECTVLADIKPNRICDKIELVARRMELKVVDGRNGDRET